MTNVRLDPTLWARVKATAGARGVTLERWVAEALEAHIARYEAQPAGHSAPTAARATATAGDLQDLYWRVEALEAAVDYLAGAIGAGFPPSSPSGGSPARSAQVGETLGHRSLRDGSPALPGGPRPAQPAVETPLESAPGHGTGSREHNSAHARGANSLETAGREGHRRRP